jgi:FixJ family two-component response regulator
MATVFLVDDDASVRRALGRLVKSAGYAVESFSAAREFLDSDWQARAPACLILDVRMPGLSGLDLQRELRSRRAILPIVFITGHGNVPMGVNAMKDGAVDFLTKPVTDDQLIEAIGRALARAQREYAERRELEDIHQRVESLTPREREVMDLVVQGLLNKQVAYELGTVEKTIKVHRARVMEKMGVESLADLVRISEKLPKEK